MPTVPYILEEVPISKPRDEVTDDFAFCLRALHGLDIFLTLSPREGRGETSTKEAACVLADLLRPGWEALAVTLAVPVVRDSTLYRGFHLLRSSTVDGRPWDLETLVPTPMAAEFDWDTVRSDLSGFHALIWGEEAHD